MYYCNIVIAKHTPIHEVVYMLSVAMWRAVDAVSARRLGKNRKWEISKNGGRSQMENEESHDIFPRALKQAISTLGGHSPGRSS